MHSLTIPVSIVLNTGVQLHNSVWTGAMNRPLRLRNVRCNCSRTPMFTPRTCNIYPRTRNVYPRTPTVGADLSCPHITECALRTFLCIINFVFHSCHSIGALMIYSINSLNVRQRPTSPPH